MATTDEAVRASDDVGHELSLSLAAKGLLASLSLGAGVIHLVMVPIHATDSVQEAIGFAVVGWLQVLAAIALLVRPSRILLQATVAVNVVAIGFWAWSRTTGLPFGAHPGIKESVGSVDLACVVFEVLLVLGAAALLLRPRLGEGVSEPLLVLASIVPVAVLVATSMVLTDPATANHSHASLPAATTVAAQRCDLGFNPGSYWQEGLVTGGATAPAAPGAATTTTTVAADGHNHATTAPAATAAPGVTTTTKAPIQGSAELDNLIGQTAKTGGEAKDAAVVVALGKVSDATYEEWLKWLPQYTAAAHAQAAAAAAAPGASPDDNSGHGGHIGPQEWTPMTDQKQCDQLSGELALAKSTAMKYPTAADAVKGGWVQVTPFVPGIAAHYMNFAYVDDTFEIDKPEMLLYDGNGPDATMVGLSYYMLHDSNFEPTQGFTGPNDHFHRHVGLCIGATGVIGDSTMTADQCAAIGGRKAEGSGGWMSHLWIVPGCESPWGLFSGANPLLDDTMAKNSGPNSGGCAGSGVRARYDLAPGSDTNTPSTIRGELAAAANP